MSGTSVYLIRFALLCYCLLTECEYKYLYSDSMYRYGIEGIRITNTICGIQSLIYIQRAVSFSARFLLNQCYCVYGRTQTCQFNITENTHTTQTAKTV